MKKLFFIPLFGLFASVALAQSPAVIINEVMKKSEQQKIQKIDQTKNTDKIKKTKAMTKDEDRKTGQTVQIP